MPKLVAILLGGAALVLVAAVILAAVTVQPSRTLIERAVPDDRLPR